MCVCVVPINSHHSIFKSNPEYMEKCSIPFVLFSKRNLIKNRVFFDNGYKFLRGCLEAQKVRKKEEMSLKVTNSFMLFDKRRNKREILKKKIVSLMLLNFCSQLWRNARKSTFFHFLLNQPRMKAAHCTPEHILF